MSAHSRLRQEAEAKFAATQMKTQEAKRAMRDHDAHTHRDDEKTARLKALRRAKEVAEGATAKPESPARRRPEQRWKRPDR